MTLTPAIKAQLTKAVKRTEVGTVAAGRKFRAIAKVFEKIMPREQAKHATRKYFALVEAERHDK